MNARKNAKGMITAIMHRNSTLEMVLWYRFIIFIAARTVNKAVIDFEQNETRERLKIHTVHLVQYIGKGTDGQQKMREHFEVEKADITIPTKVRWLAKSRTFSEKRQVSEIATSVDVFVGKGSNRALCFVTRG
jgi:short subunit dehydrogenase-like uncharacterized protein